MQKSTKQSKDNQKKFSPGACALLFVNDHPNNRPQVLLGKETQGKLKNMYNLPGGRMEPEDGGCYIRNVMRELAEEIKIQISFEQFSQIFKGSTPNIHYILNYTTPIFIGQFPQHLNTHILNTQIARANSNPSLPANLKEMSQVEWFDVNHLPSTHISDFARTVCNRAIPTIYNWNP